VSITEYTEPILTPLESITTTEARLASTIAVLVMAILSGFVIAPALVRRFVTFAGDRLEESDVGSVLEVVDGLSDIPFPMRAVIRSLQATVLLATGLVLLIIWGYGSLAVLVLSVLTTAVPVALRVVLTVSLLAGAVIGTRYLEQQLDDWLANANYVTAHQEGVVFRVLQVTIFIAVGLAALSLWQINLGGLLVGAGFLGIVMGMAAQQTLGSLIAGFVLMFSRPFEIGDWVQVGDHEGLVVDITITNTRIRSFDGEIIVLPNDKVSSATVVNRTKRNRLRLRLEVGVDYETDLEHAEAVAREALEGIDDVSPAPKPQVIPTSFDDSAITLECRFWIEQPNVHKKWTTIQAAVHALKASFDREEIDIPYPQRTVGTRAEGGFRIPDAEDGDTELAYSDRE